MKEPPALPLEEIQQFVHEWVESVVHVRPGDPIGDAAFIQSKVDEAVEREVTVDDLRAIMMRFALEAVDGVQPSMGDSRAVAHLLLEVVALAHFLGIQHIYAAFERRGFDLRKQTAAIIDPIRATMGSALSVDARVFEHVLAYARELKSASSDAERGRLKDRCVKGIKRAITDFAADESSTSRNAGMRTSNRHPTKRTVERWITALLPRAEEHIAAGYFGDGANP